MPWFAVNELKPYIPSFTKVTDQKRLKAIQKGVDHLLTMQTSDGGLSYWSGGSESLEWSTVYASRALVLAKQHGADVPQDALDKLAGYLLTRLPGQLKHKDKEQRQLGASSLYTLALMGKARESDINNFYKVRKKLNTSSRALLAMAMHKMNLNRNDYLKLLTSAKLKRVKPSYNNTDAQLLLEAYSVIDPTHKRVDELMDKIIKSAHKTGHWGNTTMNSATLNAMAAYAKSVKLLDSKTAFTVNINGKDRLIELSAQTPSQTLSVPLNEGLKILAQNDNLAYCNVTVHSKPRLKNTSPTSKNGVAIQKSYYRILKDGSREPLKNPTVGDLVEVELTVHFSDSVDYVVIDDPLPTTFECVNNAFKSQSTHVRSKAENNWSVSHQELRKDRALFFLNKSWRNGHKVISYLARITSSGNVSVPATKVEAMYDPSTYGLTASSSLLCKPSE